MHTVFLFTEISAATITKDSWGKKCRFCHIEQINLILDFALVLKSDIRH